MRYEWRMEQRKYREEAIRAVVPEIYRDRYEDAAEVIQLALSRSDYNPHRMNRYAWIISGLLAAGVTVAQIDAASPNEHGPDRPWQIRDLIWPEGTKEKVQAWLDEHYPDPIDHGRYNSSLYPGYKGIGLEVRPSWAPRP